MASSEIEYRQSAAGISTEQLAGFFVGWPSPPSPDTHLELLKKSDLVEIAVDSDSGQVVGFVTAITDGILAAYLPLLEVLPDYQHRGIGRKLTQRILDRLSHLYMTDLTCHQALEPLYRQFGLVRGVGMMKRNYAAQSGVGEPDKPEQAQREDSNMTEERTFKEELKVTGDQLVGTVKKLAREANIRRLIIKNEKSEVLMEIPLSVASVGALLLPVVAALGALAALVTHCTIEVHKVRED